MDQDNIFDFDPGFSKRSIYCWNFYPNPAQAKNEPGQYVTLIRPPSKIWNRNRNTSSNDSYGLYVQEVVTRFI